MTQHGRTLLLGRNTELTRLRHAIRERQSLLICGPPGAGKSVLVMEALASLPASLGNRSLMGMAAGTPRSVWQELARSLFAAGDPQMLSRIARETGPADYIDRWLPAQTSLRLRGILRRAMRGREYAVFLDAPAPVPSAVCRLLKDWIWSGRTPVYLTALGETERELGKAARLYWHEAMRLRVGPLDAPSARALLERCISSGQLTKVADNDFREFVLKESKCLPGAIVKLCELASQAAYQYQGRVKTHTLSVDFLLGRRTTPMHSRDRFARHE
jgi:AAA ATPase-like protein